MLFLPYPPFLRERRLRQQTATVCMHKDEPLLSTPSAISHQSAICISEKRGAANTPLVTHKQHMQHCYTRMGSHVVRRTLLTASLSVIKACLRCWDVTYDKWSFLDDRRMSRLR